MFENRQKKYQTREERGKDRKRAKKEDNGEKRGEGGRNEEEIYFKG